MGSKLAAKQLMAAAGVPVLPSVVVADPSDAASVGFPLLVKAVFGGGGRRAREVHGLVGFVDERRPGVGVGEDRHRGNTHVARRAHHPAGDLAAVGDEELGDRGHPPYMRKTPNPRRPSTGAECTAERAMPSTVRVSRGSMIPSS